MSNTLEDYKGEVSKDIQSKKMQKDITMQQNILREIKRFEKNMQVKKDEPLTISQLEHKRYSSSSDLFKIEELVKVCAFFIGLLQSFI